MSLSKASHQPNVVDTQEETPDLPDGWMWAPLRDVVESPPNVNPSDEPKREFGYIDISSICNRTFRVLGCRRLKGDEAPSRARRPVRAGDVLFSNVRTYLRNIALVQEGLDANVCSTGFTVLRPTPAIEPRFLFRYVLTDDFLNRVTPQQTGTHYPATSDRVVLGEAIPLPPLAEQKRIVAKVEELLARVNAARERLARIPAILKRFRQAILASACSGRLTTDWRESQELTAKETQKELEEHKKSIAILKEQAPHRKRRQAGAPPNSTLSNDLPAEWQTATIGDLFCVTYGLSEPLRKTRPDDPNDVPIISMANVTEWGMLQLGTTKYFPIPRAKLVALALKPGDLLFNWRNSPNWIGKTCRFGKRDRTYVNASFLLRLRPTEPDTYEEFTRLFLNYLRILGYYEHASRAAVSQSNFNASEVSAITIPFPPMSEQREIVRRVEALMDCADRAEARAKVAVARVERVYQAILAKAFRGELVPTEAELARAVSRPYEPASALLERIRAEKATTHSEETDGDGTKGRSLGTIKRSRRIRATT